MRGYPTWNKELHEKGPLQRIRCHHVGGCGVDLQSESVRVAEPVVGTPL